MRTRAFRRHHRARLMKKRRLYYVISADTPEWVDDPGRLSGLARTAKPCSCWMCGNWRKAEGPTMQERRFLCEPAR